MGGDKTAVSHGKTSSPTLLHAASDAVPQGDGGAVKHRRGTDPAKFKTTICRIWEQTGHCSFRGCAFAHGVDELRTSSSSGPFTASPKTPPLVPAAAASSTPLSSGTSSQPPLPRSVASGSKNTSPMMGPKDQTPSASFTVSTPPTSCPSAPPPPPPPPPPSYASVIAQQQMTATHGRNNNSTSPLPPSLSPLEYLAHTIMNEMTNVGDVVSVHAEARTSLEKTLAADRLLRKEIAAKMKGYKEESVMLRGTLDRLKTALVSRGVQPPPISSAAAQQPLNAAAAAFVPASLGVPTSPGLRPALPLLPSRLGSGTTTASGSSLSIEQPQAVASPTDPAQGDRLRKLLESLRMEEDY